MVFRVGPRTPAVSSSFFPLKYRGSTASRRRRTARRALVGLADLLLLDGHLGEAKRGHPQEEAPEVLPVAILDGIARVDRQAGAAGQDAKQDDQS